MMSIGQIIFILALIVLVAAVAVGGPFAPRAGEPNSTAVSKDDPNIAAWAITATFDRGYADISQPELGYASYGGEVNVVGPAEGTFWDVASLGDGGSVTLEFELPIVDGPGYDFAVFENAFDDYFLELAFVEVSSDGSNFYRFECNSLTPSDTQVGTWDTLDTTDINGLAGKYRQGYGTPFNLNELADVNELLDVSRITHVRVIDVVGSIQNAYASYDSWGKIINDPWATPFEKGGFDLDAVGVIHPKTASGDFNGDAHVDMLDYARFANAYGSAYWQPAYQAKYDIAEPNDGYIDIFDLEEFSYQWLTTEDWHSP